MSTFGDAGLPGRAVDMASCGGDCTAGAAGTTMRDDFDAFEASPVPMWVFDPQSLRILAANSAMSRAYGHARDALVGSSILALRRPEDHDFLQSYVRQPASHRLQGRVWTHLHRDGTPMRMAVHSSEVVFDGHPARLVVAHDVGEQERAQERVHLIAQAMSDAAYDYDVLTGAIWFSESFALNFGFDARAMPANVHDWAALVHPQDRARALASLAAAIEGPAAS